MRTQETVETVRFCLEQNLNVMLVGRPGVGKSAIVQQAAKDIGLPLEIWTPSLADPTDYRGLPFKTDTGAEFLQYGPMRSIMEATEPVAVFLDDLGQAPASVQAVLMQIVHGRVVDGQRIPDHVRFIAATNDRSDRAGVQGILAPLVTRFDLVLTLEPSVDDWVAWANTAGLDPRVISFARFRPDVIENIEVSKGMDKFACPRTLEHLSRAMPFIDEHPGYQFQLCVGAIGPVHGPEFASFLGLIGRIPRLDSISMLPDSATIPSPQDIGLHWAVIGLLTNALKNNKIGIEETAIYIARFPREIARVAFLDLAVVAPLIKRTTQFIAIEIGG